MAAVSYDPGTMQDEDPRARLIAGMVEDLGWCLNSYGQIEFLFGDVLWSAISMDEYREVAGDFPHGLDKRAQRLRKVLASPGRLSPYAADLLLLLERLEELSEPRHLFAHGHCTFVYTPNGDAGMIIRRFVPPRRGTGGKHERIELLVRPHDLREARYLWCTFASTAQRIIGSMYLDLGLEQIG